MRCASGLPNFIGNIRYFKGNGAPRRRAAADVVVEKKLR
jgi:hypothetical protein